MKRVFLLLFLCLMQLCVFAEDKYEVYQVSGNVKIKKNDKWVTLSKGKDVTLNDKVQIANGSKLIIVKLPSKSLYESQKSGEMSISTIKAEAVKHSNEVLGLTLRELYGKNNDGQTKVKRGVHGVTTREAELLDSSFEGVIAADIQKTIAVLMSDGNPGDHGFDTVWMKNITALSVVDGTSRYFILSNTSDKLIFVNVICINPTTNSVSVLYNEVTHPLGVMVPPDKTLSLNMYKFEACDKCRYIVFGTENSFDVAELCRIVSSLNVNSVILNNNQPSKDFKLGTVLIK